MPDHYRRGWHTSGTLMSFGAAATASRLLGLDATQTAWALGTAAAQASGNFAHLSERAMTKDFNCGHAAKSGVIAALLAREGFTGPTDALENPRGFIALYAGSGQPALLVDGLGKSWRITEVAHKPYSACRHIHASIDALLAMRDQAGFAADDVERVVARIFRTGALFVDDPAPWEPGKGLQGARFSAQFNLAVTLQDGLEGLWNLLDSSRTLAYLASSDIRRRMQAISVVPDVELDRNFPDQWASSVEVVLKDGHRYTRRVDYPLGEPENPLAPAMLADKFRRLSALAGWWESRTEEAIRVVHELDTAARLDRLLELL
jgi:2-methylcitrate dehydratase PrpD